MNVPGLDPPLRAAVEALGFDRPTPIQAAAIPLLLEGRDLVGRARTGTGKTLAFGLPLLQRIDRGRRRVQGLVLCPTRELASQVTADLRAAGKRCPGLRVVTVTGGSPGFHQARTLAEGAHLVVGTPGRVLEHLERGTLPADALRILVLDEADRMLALGFADEVDAILDRLPTDRQTVLFSATFPSALAERAARWLREPASIEAEDAPPTVEAHAAMVDDKGEALDRLLRALQPASALVFANRKVGAAEAAEALRRAGYAADALHGDRPQTERDQVMASFRNGAVRVLVATDVAARGLDVDALDLVVNLDPPEQPEDYVHRIGRTARAGRPGIAWTLLGPGQSVEAPIRELPPVPEGAPPLASAVETLWIGAGRSEKLRPGDVLGALTGDGGLAAGDVGRIEIQERCAFVAVARGAAARVARVLAKTGIKGRRVRVERVG